MSHNAEQESYATTEILKPRAQWIQNRRAEVERTGDRNVSQMHYARLGRITEEMEFVAQRQSGLPDCGKGFEYLAAASHLPRCGDRHQR